MKGLDDPHFIHEFRFNLMKHHLITYAALGTTVDMLASTCVKLAFPQPDVASGLP